MTAALSIELPPEPQSISKARQPLRDFAQACGSDAGDVALAVSEALTNALVHGYRRAASGMLRLEAWLNGDQLMVRVVDRGVGMRPNPQWSGLGIGLQLIRLIADEVSVDSSESGVRITMTFPCRRVREPKRRRRS
jgi:anti-sigma regulatory factor (Ser/Thr protein kinase)